jgi:UDP-glucose 4-epimerase
MRAMVTGATGFLGSYLTQLLVRNGETVAIVHRPHSDLTRIQGILSQVTKIRGDLMELSDIEDEILGFVPDTIFHLAWYGVGNRHHNDEDQIDKNLYSTLDLMRLAIRSGCPTWIGLGSQAEYGPQNRILDEDAPTEPTTMYGAVKLCTYLLCKQMAIANLMRFVWIRVFSAYGPKDNADWMIPYLIRMLLRGEKPQLTPGEQKWDYLYAEDAAEAIYSVATTQKAEGVFNLGSGQVHTLRRIVEQIRDIIDPSLPLGFGEVPYRSDQVMHLQADVSKLQRVTGWSPQVSLEEGLRKTVEWCQEKGNEHA